MYMYECLHEVPTPSKTKPVQSIYTGGLWLCLCILAVPI